MPCRIEYKTISAMEARLMGFDDYYHPRNNKVNFCVKCRSDWGRCKCSSHDHERPSARITYTITGGDDADHT